MNEPEYYECKDDAIDNFDTLNDVYRNTTDWIGVDMNTQEIQKEDLDPLVAFKNLYLPNNNLDEISYDEYNKDNDPYNRICNLKYELIDCKTKIDEYADKFNDNSFIKECNNISNVLEELEVYKRKIDAFVDYKIFNNEESDNEDNIPSKNEFNSIFDKYNMITDNLISQIKHSQNDVLTNNTNTMNIKYEILANPEMQMESLIERISELEVILSDLEKNIGTWDIYTQNENISVTLFKLLNFISSKMNEKYEKKHQAFKDCGNLISSFLDKKKELLDSGSYFLKIKELYAVLELCENFDNVFDYIKKRLRGIKEICDNSDQFNTLLQSLQNKIISNEERFQKLLIIYEDVLNEFSEFETILNEIIEIDNMIKSNNLII